MSSLFWLLERGRFLQERSGKGTVLSHVAPRTAGSRVPGKNPPDTGNGGGCFGRTLISCHLQQGKISRTCWGKLLFKKRKTTHNQTQITNNKKKKPPQPQNNNNLPKTQTDQVTKKPQSGGNRGWEGSGAESPPGLFAPRPLVVRFGYAVSGESRALPRSPATGSAAAAPHVCAGGQRPVTPARRRPARPGPASRCAARADGETRPVPPRRRVPPHPPDRGVARNVGGAPRQWTPVQRG